MDFIFKTSESSWNQEWFEKYSLAVYQVNSDKPGKVGIEYA